MLTIACVLKSGGIYKPADVGILYRGIVRAGGADFDRFICLTDMEEGVKALGLGEIETIKLAHNWPGWWSKMELFRDVFEEGDRIIYFDLDTLCLGNLADIAAVKPRWVMLGDFYRRPPKYSRIGLASGMMSWIAGDQIDIYKSFARNPQQVMDICGRAGDQEWIARQNPKADLWENIVPGQVVSYKVHCRESGIMPTGARVVCFHGSPKPFEAPEEWIKAYMTA
jgi:hypothetical protein